MVNLDHVAYRFPFHLHISLPGPLGRVASNPAKSGSALPWKRRKGWRKIQQEIKIPKTCSGGGWAGLRSRKKTAKVTLPVLIKTGLLRILPMKLNRCFTHGINRVETANRAISDTLGGIRKYSYSVSYKLHGSMNYIHTYKKYNAERCKQFMWMWTMSLYQDTVRK